LVVVGSEVGTGKHRVEHGWMEKVDSKSPKVEAKGWKKTRVSFESSVTKKVLSQSGSSEADWRRSEPSNKTFLAKQARFEEYPTKSEERSLALQARFEEYPTKSEERSLASQARLD